LLSWEAIVQPNRHTKTALKMAGGTAPALKAPAALYEGAVAAGAAKASASWSKIFKLGIVSGAHIGFGSYLAITVGGAVSKRMQIVEQDIISCFESIYKNSCYEVHLLTFLILKPILIFLLH